jgi:hypothetical protein
LYTTDPPSRQGECYVRTNSKCSVGKKHIGRESQGALFTSRKVTLTLFQYYFASSDWRRGELLLLDPALMPRGSCAHNSPRLSAFFRVLCVADDRLKSVDKHSVCRMNTACLKTCNASTLNAFLKRTKPTSRILIAVFVYLLTQPGMSKASPSGRSTASPSKCMISAQENCIDQFLSL